MLIAANRRRPNLGEYIKPTIPRRFVQHGPDLEAGSFPCNGADIDPCKKGACDLCKHVEITKEFKSPWDGRRWKIRKHLKCSTPNLIYLFICKCKNHEEDAWYIGSATDMRKRWRNHRSDFLNKRITKCGFAQHSSKPHPEVQKYQPLPFISVVFLEAVRKEENLLEREIWWQCNVGTIFFGLNKRKDTRSVAIQKARKIF